MRPLVTLPVVLLVAGALLAGCESKGGSSTKQADENSYAPPPRPARTSFPNDANDWTCGDFDEAPTERRDQAIAELVGAAQLRGRGAELLEEIRSLCAESSVDFQPGIRAVDKVAARNTPKLDQSSDDSGSGSGEATPPPDPQRSEPRQGTPPSAPPQREPYCDEADAPDRLAPGCQGTLVPR